MGVKPKVAIVCDWLVARGGAERVIQGISEIFPEAPIYTSIFNAKKFPEFAEKKIITSFIQQLPAALTKHHLYLPLMPYAFEEFDLSEFDIVISSSHSCSKGIITKPKTLHICYCHSPMRYVWEDHTKYFQRFGVPLLLKLPAKNLLHRLRLWDRLAADRADAFIANSRHVQLRIEKYYRRDSTVIYPFVDTEKFTPGPEKPGQYFLAVGRLAAYKRFDLLVDVFRETGIPLIVVGTGKEEKKLMKKGGRFITFLGAVSDAELKNLYQNCKALVFPQTEDFGITPLEAMSCGKPVIAYSEGGCLETVIPGKTGLFFMEQTIPSLKKTLFEFQGMGWNAIQICEHARKFSKKAFQEQLRNFIDEKWEIWKRDMRAKEPN
ncbi:glycosyltransferase [Candidatus Peregrinibacteria bacterium]|nr:glycosyltransferase [Candidatus Peregrinibacteria bacterium]